MTPIITSVPIRLDLFFKGADLYRDFDLDRDKSVLHIRDMGDDDGEYFSVAKVTENGEGEIFHSNYKYYFLILREIPKKLLFKRAHECMEFTV